MVFGRNSFDPYLPVLSLTPLFFAQSVEGLLFSFKIDYLCDIFIVFALCEIGEESFLSKLPMK
jgi:hypothetical protein